MSIALSVGPATDTALSDALDGAALPVLQGTSKELTADIETNNAEFAALATELQTSRQWMETVLANAEADDYGSVVHAIEQAKFDKPEALQRVVKAWGNRYSLAERMRDELRAHVGPAEARRDKILAEVKENLESIGFSVEGMQYHAVNGDACERQLDWFVRNHPECRAAIADAHDCANRVRAAVSQMQQSLAGKQRAANYLRALALKAASV